MSPDDLREWLTAAPFVPLRIHMGKGRTMDVRHPEMMIVADEAAAVTVEENGHTSIRLIALININEVEQLAAAM